MRTRMWTRTLLAVTAVALAVGLVAVGHATAGTDAARKKGYAAGWASGHADGVREGRALQGTTALPTDSQRAARDAFNAGYAAGANDAFGGYDGGWDFSAPYVVVLVPGGTGITYRIDTRARLRTGVNYYLCPPSLTLCQEQRR